MNEREKFEVWYAVTTFDYGRDPIGSRECGLKWEAWQACAAEKDKELAALQARVKELEGFAKNVRDNYECDHSTPCRSCLASTILSKPIPDQALQRMLLDARIKQMEKVKVLIITKGEKPYLTSKILMKLRAKRAELGE